MLFTGGKRSDEKSCLYFPIDKQCLKQHIHIHVSNRQYNDSQYGGSSQWSTRGNPGLSRIAAGTIKSVVDLIQHKKQEYDWPTNKFDFILNKLIFMQGNKEAKKSTKDFYPHIHLPQ